MKRTKKEIPKNETKPARFVRVVTPRVSKALKAIKTVGFCTGASYEYTPQQADQIVKALTGAVVDLSKRLAKTKPAETTGFEFKS